MRAFSWNSELDGIMRAHNALRAYAHCDRWQSEFRRGWSYLIGKQPITLGLDDLVTLTNRRLQACSVDDRHVATLVANEPGVLEAMRGDGDRFSAHAKHIRNELLRHEEFV